MSVAALASVASRALNFHLAPEKPVIDSLVSKCHYRLTVAILFLSCALCTAYQLIGTSIECLVGDAFKGKEHVINSYCWITSTFTLPINYGKQIGFEVAAHGVGPYVPGEDEPLYHNYYQWVPFVLFFLGLLFLAPHWFWKTCEGRKIEMVSEGLRGQSLDINTSRLKSLVTYLVITKHSHKMYIIKYILSEVLYLFIVFGSFHGLNRFLGGQFTNYGWEVLKYTNLDQEDRMDPMMAIFPRITKCKFHKYGSSGSIEQHDSLCILPLNIMNEKIFVFLWFWFYVLCFLSAVNIVYLIFIVFYSPIRKLIMERRFKYKSPSGVAFLCKHLEFDDFGLLYLLRHNLNDGKFQALLQEYYRQLCHLDGIKHVQCLLPKSEDTPATGLSEVDNANHQMPNEEIQRSALNQSSSLELNNFSEEDILELREITSDNSTLPSTQRLLINESVRENYDIKSAKK
ncbi:hypothetical protein C0J52_13846 [Blattella germanica]|nr:hypothetical protein C0J52_13846 [Blattella germanica]